MSEQTHVDPEKLEDFALALKDYYGGVDRVADRLLAELGRLGRSWQDPAFEEFQAHVRRLAEVLLQFVGDAEGFSTYLVGKAGEAREIHRKKHP